jgi:hypothetical protein
MGSMKVAIESPGNLGYELVTITMVWRGPSTISLDDAGFHRLASTAVQSRQPRKR